MRDFPMQYAPPNGAWTFAEPSGSPTAKSAPRLSLQRRRTWPARSERAREKTLHLASGWRPSSPQMIFDGLIDRRMAWISPRLRSARPGPAQRLPPAPLWRYEDPFAACSGAPRRASRILGAPACELRPRTTAASLIPRFPKPVGVTADKEVAAAIGQSFCCHERPGARQRWSLLADDRCTHVTARRVHA